MAWYLHKHRDNFTVIFTLYKESFVIFSGHLVFS